MTREERGRLFLYFTDEVAQKHVESFASEVSNLSIRRLVPVTHTRTCDCVIEYMSEDKRMMVFVKFKPTKQSFLDALKQLKQERIGHSSRLSHSWHYLIVTYDWNTEFDLFLRKEYAYVERAS